MSYIAYKGFNKDLGTPWGKNTKFEIGQTYSKINPVENPRLCTNDGFHYCDKITHVFRYYPSKEKNRYCEIEVLGHFTKGEHGEGFKNTTTSFRIIREIFNEEIDKLLELEKIQIEKEEVIRIENLIPQNLKLPIVREIQERYPMMHIGGSAGLFLHGIRLKRWEKQDASDLDMVSPYFILLESSKIRKKNEKGEWESNVTIEEIKKSGNDFDSAVIYYSEELGNVKVDIKIDPKQAYEIIEWEGFRYKVSKLETILEAKIRYAMQAGGEKHKGDIYEICGKIKKS